MSFHYSVEQEGESLAAKSSDGKRSDTSSGKVTAKKSSSKESKTESSMKPQYSAISEHSLVKGTPDDIEEWLTLLVEDSPANPSQSQENEKPQMTSEICGQQHWTLSRQSSRPLCFLRTYPDYSQQQWTTNQADLFTTLERYCETWPKAGTISNGQCWELMMSEHHTIESDYGFSEYMPTPNTMDTLPCRSFEAMKRQATVGGRKNRTAPGNLREWINPEMHKAYQEASIEANGVGPEMWPTPQARDGKGISGRAAKGEAVDLPAAVKFYPTPGAADNRDRGGPSTPAIQRRKEIGKSIELSMTVDGALSPMWVEWLMGWPIKQTDLKPLGTDKFHSQWLRPMQSYLTNLITNG